MSDVTPQRLLEISDNYALIARTYEVSGYQRDVECLRQLADQLGRTEANEFNAIWVINKHLAGTDEVSTFNDAMEIVRKAGRKLERNAEVLIWIENVACGKYQVAEDDTEALEMIAQKIREDKC